MEYRTSNLREPLAYPMRRVTQLINWIYIMIVRAIKVLEISQGCRVFNRGGVGVVVA